MDSVKDFFKHSSQNMYSIPYSIFDEQFLINISIDTWLLNIE